MAKTLMFVDDNRDERILIKRQANKALVGLHLIEAADGQEAINTLDTMSPDELPSMVLLDLKMPKVDGLQVLQWIRQQEKTKHLPVVMFSTSDDEGDIQRSYDLGANSYVIKGVQEHKKCLDILLIYWSEINKKDTQTKPASRQTKDLSGDYCQQTNSAQARHNHP